MKLKFLPILIGILFYLMNSCSTSSEEIKTDTGSIDSNYVFDEIPPEDVYKFEKPETIKTTDTIYIIQIGAFSTMDKAREFADYSRLKIKKDIKVEFNQKKNLYVVQIHPAYRTKLEALRFRNELIQFEEYRDAWVITQVEPN
jgi:cell division septation protein DedD